MTDRANRAAHICVLLLALAVIVVWSAYFVDIRASASSIVGPTRLINVQFINASMPQLDLREIFCGLIEKSAEVGALMDRDTLAEFD